MVKKIYHTPGKFNVCKKIISFMKNSHACGLSNTLCRYCTCVDYIILNSMKITRAFRFLTTRQDRFEACYLLHIEQYLKKYSSRIRIRLKYYDAINIGRRHSSKFPIPKNTSKTSKNKKISCEIFFVVFVRSTYLYEIT